MRSDLQRAGSWRQSAYDGVPVEVPEILKKIPGPRARTRRPAFAGMGLFETGPEIYSPHTPGMAVPDPGAQPAGYEITSWNSGGESMEPYVPPTDLYTAGDDPIIRVNVEEALPTSLDTVPFGDLPNIVGSSYMPPDLVMTDPVTGEKKVNWWLLALIAGGIYLITR